MIFLLWACVAEKEDVTPGTDRTESHLDSRPVDTATAAIDSATTDSATTDSATTDSQPSPPAWQQRFPNGDPFADALVSFTPGAGAGFGQEGLPDIVLGSPESPGGGAGSLDVLSLGEQGEIVLQFLDYGVVDEEGPDLLIFENPLSTWKETGEVAVSEDGLDWATWPCAEDGSGCAGINLVYASSTNGVDPTDPAVAGGDAFDLGAVGLTEARYVRLRDSGRNSYAGNSGGFDLDAVAVIHGKAL